LGMPVGVHIGLKCVCARLWLWPLYKCVWGACCASLHEQAAVGFVGGPAARGGPCPRHVVHWHKPS